MMNLILVLLFPVLTVHILEQEALSVSTLRSY